MCVRVCVPECVCVCRGVSPACCWACPEHAEPNCRRKNLCSRVLQYPVCTRTTPQILHADTQLHTHTLTLLIHYTQAPSWKHTALFSLLSGTRFNGAALQIMQFLLYRLLISHIGGVKRCVRECVCVSSGWLGESCSFVITIWTLLPPKRKRNLDLWEGSIMLGLNVGSCVCMCL